jgi:L-arabinose transport system substrate-binding protein
MKPVSIVLLLILLASPVLSMGGKEPEKSANLQFAILIKKGDEHWYRRQAEGFKDGCIEMGVIPVIMDNKMDPNITLVNMDLAIEKKVNAVAIVIPEQKMGPVIVNRAFESDIAIISIDHKLLDHQGRQLAPHIGIDDRAAGYAAGVWLAGRIAELDWYGSKTNLIGIAGLTNEEIPEYLIRVNECQRALFEWLPGLKGNSYYKVDYPGSDAVGGLLAMQELLNIHPEVTNWIVIASTDEGGIGAVRALEQVGLGSHSIACGIQAERAFREFSKDTESAFVGAVYYDPYLLGRRAAKSLYRFFTDSAVIPAETSVPFRIITEENYSEVFK